VKACPTCGSDEYVWNGVDGYICLECSTQFFVETEEEIICPNCGATYFESYDEITGEYICFCGHVFGGEFSDEES
jgi:hypothetical protein